jgi:hypothetical protein
LKNGEPFSVGIAEKGFLMFENEWPATDCARFCRGKFFREKEEMGKAANL